jgi:hypothetical protein
MTSTAGDGQQAIEEVGRLRAENEALKTQLARRVAWRKWSAVLLVVLTTLTVIGATVVVWTHQLLYQTDAFMETVDPLLDDDAFYIVLGDYLSEQTLSALDIETRLTESLTSLDEYLSEQLLETLDVTVRQREILALFDRPTLADLAPGMAEGLEARITNRIEGFISSDAFEARLPVIVRDVHEATIALIRGDLSATPNVYIEAGEVRVNLLPVIADVLRDIANDIRAVLPDFELPELISESLAEGRAQIAAAIQAELPDDFAQVTLISQGELEDIQAAAQRFDQAAWGLVILAILLVPLTIAISPTRRRTTFQLGLGIVIAMIVGSAILGRLEEAFLGQFTDPAGTDAARTLFDEVVASLQFVFWLVGGAALITAITAYLVGNPAWLTKAANGARNLTGSGANGNAYDTWMTDHFDLLRLAGVAVALISIFVVGLSVLSTLVIGALLALYLWVISSATHRVAATELVSETSETEKTGQTTTS